MDAKGCTPRERVSVLALSPSEEQAASRTKADEGRSTLAITIALIATFSVFLVYNEDPWALGRTFVMGTAYLVAIALSAAWLANSTTRKRSALILLLGTIVVLGGVYAISGGVGYPSSNTYYSTTNSCVTTTGGTNSSGYPIHGTQTICTGHDIPYQNIPLALGSNLIAWMPLVGCLLFSLPASREASPRSNKLASFLGGCFVAAAILLNLVGIQSTGSLTSVPAVHMPLNPYPAYGECDSITALNGCVYVNQLYVLADYAFWLGVVGLASIATSQFAARRMGSKVPIRKAAVCSLALVLVIIVGLVVIPTTVADSGVIVDSGSSFSFYALNSYIRVPFTVSHTETLSGTFQSSAALDVYVLNSTQFLSYDDAGGYCPIAHLNPLLVNATRGTIATSIGSGSYSLLFCGASALQRNLPSIQLTISSPLRLSL